MRVEGGVEVPPARLLNVRAQPDADVFVRGRCVPVRAREATAAQPERLSPRMSEMYEGFDHYRSIARREMPLVVLERR